MLVATRRKMAICFVTLLLAAALAGPLTVNPAHADCIPTNSPTCTG